MAHDTNYKSRYHIFYFIGAAEIQVFRVETMTYLRQPAFDVLLWQNEPSFETSETFLKALYKFDADLGLLFSILHELNPYLYDIRFAFTKLLQKNKILSF